MANYILGFIRNRTTEYGVTCFGIEQYLFI